MADKDYFSTATAVTLEQMLESREQRVQTQQTLIERFGKPLICFTLNTPGAYKLYPLARRAFAEGGRAIERELQSSRLTVLHYQSSLAATGCEGYYVVDAGAPTLKAQMMRIERYHPLGRLFDIDVLDTEQNTVKGADFGRGERNCLICGQPVWQCSRSRAHPAEQLALRAAEIMDEYFTRQFADKVCQAAIKALLYEVNITPKPGLVDRANTGAHHDMDTFTFVDSSCSLIPYFRDITLQALDFSGGAEQLLPELRYLGSCAEADMFTATSGVNTHKGMIFSMGIVCAALGYLHGHDIAIAPEPLFDICAKIAAGSIPELEAVTKEQATYGQKAYAQYKITGVRGEAAAGFPHVRGVGYPILSKYAQRGCALNEAGVIALLHLMAQVDDTNIANRSSLRELREIQAELTALISSTEDATKLLQSARELDEKLIAKNLSPGGSADLLAIALLVYWATQPDLF